MRLTSKSAPGYDHTAIYVEDLHEGAHILCFRLINRDLKQTRTATAVNKQLNVTVKDKPYTTNYIYCIFEAYFMIKSV